MLYKQILICKVMDSCYFAMTRPSASKIDWTKRPKALVIRFAYYYGDDYCRDEYITIKVVFKRGLRRAPVQRTHYLDDRCLTVKSVKSYEVLKEESSKHYSTFFHIISALDCDMFSHPSELKVYTSPEYGEMYYQVQRQVEE